MVCDSCERVRVLAEQIMEKLGNVTSAAEKYKVDLTTERKKVYSHEASLAAVHGVLDRAGAPQAMTIKDRVAWLVDQLEEAKKGWTRFDELCTEIQRCHRTINELIGTASSKQVGVWRTSTSDTLVSAKIVDVVRPGEVTTGEGEPLKGGEADHLEEARNANSKLYAKVKQLESELGKHNCVVADRTSCCGDWAPRRDSPCFSCRFWATSQCARRLP